VARTQRKINKQKEILRAIHTNPGIHVKGAAELGGSQPPKKKRLMRVLIRIMLAYSPRKKREKLREEYSTL
jgi:hypothetical protein